MLRWQLQLADKAALEFNLKCRARTIPTRAFWGPSFFVYYVRHNVLPILSPFLESVLSSILVFRRLIN